MKRGTKYYLITDIRGTYKKTEIDRQRWNDELILIETRYKNVPVVEFECGSKEYFTSQTSGLSIFTVDTSKRTRLVVAEYTDNKYFYKLVKEIKNNEKIRY